VAHFFSGVKLFQGVPSPALPVLGFLPCLLFYIVFFFNLCKILPEPDATPAGTASVAWDAG
jgi:hypothetical protein